MARKNASNAIAKLFPYVATTRGITVRVAVSFLAEQSDPRASRWFWSYHIRIENGSETAVQLLTRQWHITDGKGAVHDVHGEGVVGQTPSIPPRGSFDYVSGCPLGTATGSMAGSYRMIDETGTMFDITVPTFPLVGPVS